MSEQLDKEKLLNKFDEVIKVMEVNLNRAEIMKANEEYYMTFGSVATLKEMKKIIEEGKFDKEVK